MISLFREAKELQRFLKDRPWPFCFIDGIALLHWGEPRVTRDLDVTVYTGFGGEEPVVEALLERYAGRVTDAHAFAVRHRVVLCATPAGVPVDVALGGLTFEAEMTSRASDVEFEPGIALRICSAEDLVVLKAFADRPRDRLDVEGVAARRGPELDWEGIVTRLTPLVEVKGESAILERVRKLAREFGRQEG